MNNYYTPIVRWKRAERIALKELADELRPTIKPLIEFLVPPPNYNKFKNTEEAIDESKIKFEKVINNLVSDIEISCKNLSTFVELNLITHPELKIKTANFIIGNDLPVVPVIGVEYHSEVNKLFINNSRKKNTDLCLRIFIPDLKNENTNKEITEFVSKNLVNYKDTHLILDLKLVSDMSAQELSNLVKQIPKITKWKTVTVIGGSFPVNLSGCEIGVNYIERKEWSLFTSIDFKSLTGRSINFGDYTIQHPIFAEPPAFSNPSASIRYTLESNWLVMKGRGLRTEGSAKFKQYPAQARLLSELPDCKPRSYSWGDEYIYEKGEDLETKKTGTPETWLRAGFNHHITLVAKQVSSFDD